MMTKGNAFDRTKLLTHEQKAAFAQGLEEALDVSDCRHNHEHARRVLDQLGLDSAHVEEVLEFCEYHGGYCDCEVMLNVVYGD